MIAVEHLTKHFRDRTRNKIIAVDDSSFTVNDGEVVGLLGPNGAGKTTIMRLLATVLQPTAGLARIDGYDTRTHAREVRRRLGILPETWDCMSALRHASTCACSAGITISNRM